MCLCNYIPCLLIWRSYNHIIWGVPSLSTHSFPGDYLNDGVQFELDNLKNLRIIPNHNTLHSTGKNASPNIIKWTFTVSKTKENIVSLSGNKYFEYTYAHICQVSSLRSQLPETYLDSYTLSIYCSEFPANNNKKRIHAFHKLPDFPYVDQSYKTSQRESHVQHRTTKVRAVPSVTSFTVIPKVLKSSAWWFHHLTHLDWKISTRMAECHMSIVILWPIGTVSPNSETYLMWVLYEEQMRFHL